MVILIEIVIVFVGVVLFYWWRSITNERRPYHIPQFLKHNEGLVLLGYLVWSSMVILGLFLLFKESTLLSVTIIAGLIIVALLLKRNMNLDSQIVWIFKIYKQEKQDRKNHLVNDTELLQIIAKRYLSTMGNSETYYLFEKNPPTSLKDLACRLIGHVQYIWIDPRLDSEKLEFWDRVKTRVDILYERYFK